MSADRVVCNMPPLTVNLLISRKQREGTSRYFQAGIGNWGTNGFRVRPQQLIYRHEGMVDEMHNGKVKSHQFCGKNEKIRFLFHLERVKLAVSGGTYGSCCINYLEVTFRSSK